MSAFPPPDPPGRENLWAPWRVGFILGPKPAGCFLCASPRAGTDAESLVLERGRRCFAILNRYPYNNGHLMVAPYEHAGDLAVLDPETAAELMHLTQRWLKIVREAMHPDGFNLGFNLGSHAGAGVADHLHQHVVPRWGGDTNFMTVVGGLRVVNQSLQDAHALLVETMQRIDAAAGRATDSQ